MTEAGKTSESVPYFISPHEASARAKSIALASMVIAVVVGLVTVVVRGTDFGPMHNIVLAEDRMLHALLPPPLETRAHYRPVVYVEVDQETAVSWARNVPVAGDAKLADVDRSCSESGQNLDTNTASKSTRSGISQGTPRFLIACLVRSAREAGASVIYLDYDFRNHLPDDELLSKTLSQNDEPTVLLPRYVAGRDPVICDNGQLYSEFSTVFDELRDRKAKIEFVHPYFTLSSYGLVEKVCHSYLTKGTIDETGPLPPPENRESAMLMAVQLSHDRRSSEFDSPEIGSSERDSTGHFTLHWRVGPDDVGPILSSDGTTMLFRKIRAKDFLALFPAKYAGDTSGVKLPGNPIVIVGSSHEAVSDFIQTPLGLVPGVLAHVNLAIDLQMNNPVDVSEWFHFPVLFELLLDLTIVAVLTWRFSKFLAWLLRNTRLLAIKAPWSNLAIAITEFVFMAISLIGACVCILLISAIGQHFGYDFVGGRRFSLLVSVVGFVAVCAIECVRILADTVESRAEHYFLSHSSPLDVLQKSHENPAEDRDTNRVGVQILVTVKDPAR